jgi:hypothetical protein
VARPRLRLEIVAVNEGLVPRAIEASTRTGCAGEARRPIEASILVTPMDECVHIPNGKTRHLAGR